MQTTVSMSAVFMHWSPELFPDPLKFNPDRWLSSSSQLTNFLVTFSRGARMCLGMIYI